MGELVDVVLRRRGRGGPLDPLLRAEHPAGQAGAGRGDPRAGAEVGVGGVRGARRRQGGPGQQAGARLAADRRSGRASTRTSATRASSTTACTATSRRTARSRSSRRCRAASCTPDELRRIADVADKYDVPLVKLTGGQRIDLVGVPKEQLPAVWQRPRHAGGLRLGQELPHLQELHRHRLSAASASATAWGWR